MLEVDGDEKKGCLDAFVMCALELARSCEQFHWILGNIGLLIFHFEKTDFSCGHLIFF
jgi:hypothetical protein